MVIDENGVESLTPFPPAPPARACSNTSTSPAPTASCMASRSTRRASAFGRVLAKGTPRRRRPDRPVPDGGNPAALGFSEPSGIPFGFGIIRNHYVGRTFIQPTQTGPPEIHTLARKHAPNKPILEGKRVVLVDDSIVRGNTSQRIVQMIRDAGADRSPLPRRLAPDQAPGLLRHRHALEGELIASSA